MHWRYNNSQRLATSSFTVTQRKFCLPVVGGGGCTIVDEARPELVVVVVVVAGDDDDVLAERGDDMRGCFASLLSTFDDAAVVVDVAVVDVVDGLATGANSKLSSLIVLESSSVLNAINQNKRQKLFITNNSISSKIDIILLRRFALLGRVRIDERRYCHRRCCRCCCCFALSVAFLAFGIFFFIIFVFRIRI